jgi:hypothetical protein
MSTNVSVSTDVQTNILDIFDDEPDMTEACLAAVRAAYRNVAGHMDVRPLWSGDRVHYFRVNWWWRHTASEEERIGHSAFVLVWETRSGLVVREDSGKHAERRAVA